MTYVKTYLPTLKTHVVNLKRDAKDMSRDLQRLEVRGKLGSKTLYSLSSTPPPPHLLQTRGNDRFVFLQTTRSTIPRSWLT